MFSFLNNKTSLIVWTIFSIIISVVFFAYIVFHLFVLGYPKMSEQAQQVGEKMSDLRINIEHIGNQNNNLKKTTSGAYVYVKNYEGINCNSNDTIKSDCDYINSVAGAMPTILSSADKYCIFIKYEHGFYKPVAYNQTERNKYLCIDNNSNSAPGSCDIKTLTCTEIAEKGSSLDTESIILLFCLFVALIMSIVLIVRLMFSAPVAGILLVLSVVLVFFVLYIFFTGRIF